MCGCNKSRNNVVGRSSTPRRNTVSAQSTRRSSPPPQVQAQSVTEKKGMTSDRRQRERERREILLSKLGRL